MLKRLKNVVLPPMYKVHTKLEIAGDKVRIIVEFVGEGKRYYSYQIQEISSWEEIEGMVTDGYYDCLKQIGKKIVVEMDEDDPLIEEPGLAEQEQLLLAYMKAKEHNGRTQD